jgi:hypothetical protein
MVYNIKQIHQLFNKYDIYCRVIGAIITCLGLYLVAWGKSKDYTPSDPVIQEFIFSTDEGNVKNEHFAQEIVTIQ